jgi:CHAT domain-containing protein/tetratricopeptide (TPR) repeat protein
MNRMELARQLAFASSEERASLLDHHVHLLDAPLGWQLRSLYLESYAGDPDCAAGSAASLTALAERVDNPEVRALAAWTAGMAVLQLEGRLERAIELIDEAAAAFQALGQPHSAAATQVSKVYALAMLGRYDEAIDSGLRARDLFLAADDLLAVGKIEQNLGNIYHRRDQHHEAERFYRTARERFREVGDNALVAVAENGLANVLALQHQFRAARELYEHGLECASAAGAGVTQAEIECNLGCLALFQAQYDRALDFLERSRRRYAALDMPVRSALAEQELADAYLEINLATEAANLHRQTAADFEKLGMRAERARALAGYGRAMLLLERVDEARRELAVARDLYTAEGNRVGAARVILIEAQLHLASGHYDIAASAAAEAEPPLAEGGLVGRLLLARWLRGEALRSLGQEAEARQLLEVTLRDSEQSLAPQIAERCHTSFGLLAAASGDREAAEDSFRQAVALIETMRAPLPAEEFQTAFLADKLLPYSELVRLCLADKALPRVAEALEYVERARSRALLDMLGGSLQRQRQPRDEVEEGLLSDLVQLQEELNWFYSQINRPPEGDSQQAAGAVALLYEAAREREAAILDLTRKLQQRSDPLVRSVELLDVARLQRALEPDLALIEYFSLDGMLLAFVVTKDNIEVVEGLGREAQVQEALEGFRFQIDTMRYGHARLQRHHDQLLARANHYLNILYNLLMEPLERRLAARRLVVIPHRSLYYLPFHALYDGQQYLVERYELSYAPSATVLQHCIARPRRPLRRALLLGVSDEQAPRVRDEIRSLASLFPHVSTLLDENASLAALRGGVVGADLVHLACHGHFRPDNPLFSSLRLSDGWLTARDTYELELDCELVTLSACETGLSAIAPGDELIGLVRGFFTAGAPSLLVSLWTVDDESTAWLMSNFYKRLRGGERPAAALRQAQYDLLAERRHPFFWSPFLLMGRW